MHTDFELINKCRKGNLKAQSELYSRYSARMLGVCMKLVGNKMEAEDVLQNGFIRVFSCIDQFRMQGSLEGWIRKIMITTSINHFKKNHKIALESEIETIENIVTAPENVLDHLSVQELMQLIQEMPNGYRIIFSLHAIEGYKHEEIAQMLDINENTSKSQLSRARQYLKKKILIMTKEKVPVYDERLS